MTRAELLRMCPRPWRVGVSDAGMVLDAEGVVILKAGNHVSDDEAVALAQLVVDWSNEADDGSPNSAPARSASA